MAAEAAAAISASECRPRLATTASTHGTKPVPLGSPRRGEVRELQMAMRVDEAGKQHAVARGRGPDRPARRASPARPTQTMRPPETATRPSRIGGPVIGSSQPAWISSIVRISHALRRARASTRERRRLGVPAGEGGRLVAPAVGVAHDLVVHGAALRHEAGVLDRCARSRPRSGGSARRPPRPRSPRSSGCRSRWRRSAARPGRSSRPASPTRPARSGSCRASRARRPASAGTRRRSARRRRARCSSGWKVQAMKAVKPPVRSCSSRRCSRCSIRSSSVSTWPNIMVAVVRMPEPMRRLHHLEPLGGRALGDADDRRARGRTGSRRRRPGSSRAPPPSAGAASLRGVSFETRTMCCTSAGERPWIQIG